MKRWIAAMLLLLLCAGCGKPVRTASDFFAMDTFMSISVDSAPAEQAQSKELLTQMERRINQLDKAMTRTQQTSDIYRLNHADGQTVTVSADTYAAIEQAVSYADFTGGAFDPTTAPLTDLWGIGTAHARVPEESELSHALAKVDYRNIELLGGGQVRLKNGAQLDLGGIGKGYATDAVAALYRDVGLSAGVLALLGGNIGAYGENPNRNGGDWTIGIADPDDNSQSIATVSGQDITVVTSGDYERFFEKDGTRYHHIFDTKTGYPAKTDLRSVSVIDTLSARADALTTALFVMGYEKGVAFCTENDIAAVFVKSDKTVYATQAVARLGTFSLIGQDRGYFDAK